MKIYIRKPLYETDEGDFVYIRVERLNEAIAHKELLEVETPRTVARIDPYKWKKEGKRMEKVFKIPNRPMILYGGVVPLKNYE